MANLFRLGYVFCAELEVPNLSLNSLNTKHIIPLKYELVELDFYKFIKII